MKLYHLLPTKRNIKFLKPDNSGNRIYFYSTIKDCLRYQRFFINPGIYYVYEYEYECKSDDEIEILGSDVILGFLKKVNVTYVGYIDYTGYEVQPMIPFPVNPGYGYPVFNYDHSEYPKFHYKWIPKRERKNKVEED